MNKWYSKIMSRAKSIITHAKTQLESYSKKRLILLVVIAMIIVLGITMTVSGITFAFIGRLVEGTSKQASTKDKDMPGGVADNLSFTEKKQTVPPDNGSIRSPATPTASSNAGQTSPSSGSTQKSIPNTCTKTDVVPFITNYKDAPYLATGQTEASGGTDGFTYICPAGDGKTTSTLFAAINKTVYVGTGPTQAEIQASQAAANQLAQDQAARTATNARNDRIAACIQSVYRVFGASGAGGSSDESYAVSQCYSTP